MAGEKYLKLSPSDFLYGCRSGIQKAIRRGDLPLAKQCFDALWANKAQRAWLKWRTVAIVQEECSYYLGELAEFLEKKSDDEREWRRIFYEVTLTLKNKDGTALWGMARRKAKINSQELKFIQPFFQSAHMDPTVVASEVLDKVMALRSFSKYEERALLLLRRRVGLGGHLGDRQNCLTNMVFIAFRPLVKEEVKKVVDGCVDGYLAEHGSKIEVNGTAALPWYVLDQHTLIGKVVTKIVMKRKGKAWGFTSDQDFGDVWFLFSSGFVPRTMMKYTELKPDPTPFECCLEIPFIQTAVPKVGGRSSREMKTFWDRVIAPEVKKTAEWLVEKRRSYDG